MRHFLHNESFDIPGYDDANDIIVVAGGLNSGGDSLSNVEVVHLIVLLIIY